MINKFKEIVDNTRNTISVFNNDHNKLAAYLGIDISKGFTSNTFINHFTEEIKHHLTPVGESSSIEFQNLLSIENNLVYESILNSVDNSEYLKVIEKIRSVSAKFKSLDERESWKKAVIGAMNYIYFQPPFGDYKSPAGLRNIHPMEADTALAGWRLKGMGCEVIVNDNSLEIASGHENIVNTIESEIKYLGGLSVMKSLFNHLIRSGRYISQLQRYMIIHEFPFNYETITPFIPYGYILSLCAKYPYDNSQNIKPFIVQEKINYIVDTSKLLSTVLEVQHYSYWPLHMPRAGKMPDLVRKLALFDSVMSFSQSRQDLEVETLLPLFKWVDQKKIENAYGFTLFEIVNVIKTISELLKEQCGPVVIYMSAIKKALKTISDDRLKKILHVISHPLNTINTEFKFCSDFEKSNFQNYPLIKITDTKYILCDKSWCAPSYYEAIAAIIRKLHPLDADTKVGVALEEFIYDKFRSKNILFAYGNYIKPLDGQCDMVIEGKDAIVLIEIKKKVLTRKSKAGIDTSIFIDLASSLLDAQIQNGRTEILLRKNDFIELMDTDGKIQKVSLNGRGIERIALTHFDFGSFQDRSIISGILTNLVSYQITPTSTEDATVVKAFHKIEKMRMEWQKQYQELNVLDPGFNHFPFSNCWYLSLQQILLILNSSNDNDSFVKALLNTKHVSLSSLNFYHEFHVANFNKQNK